MRDYQTPTNLETQEQLIQAALNNDLPFETIPGALNDETLICNNYKLTFKGVKPRKYIYLSYTYRNSQSNDLYILMTDKDDFADEFINRKALVDMEEEEEEEEEEGACY